MSYILEYGWDAISEMAPERPPESFFCVELCVLRGEHGMSPGWRPFGRVLPARFLLCCKGAPYGMQQKLCLGKLPTLSTLNGSSLKMAMLTIRRCALVIARSLKKSLRQMLCTDRKAEKRFFAPGWKCDGVRLPRHRRVNTFLRPGRL